MHWTVDICVRRGCINRSCDHVYARVHNVHNATHMSVYTQGMVKGPGYVNVVCHVLELIINQRWDTKSAEQDCVFMLFLSLSLH